jgi:hypothetical protein
MANRFVWDPDKVQEKIKSVISKRIAAACIHLTNAIKVDISQSGTLRYNKTLKSGKASKAQKTVYNFTHSRPGNPPYKQTGQYRRSIAYEVVNLVGRVGTNMPLGKWLELGTRHMAPRPHILANFLKHKQAITAIIQATIKPGELVIGPTEHRSGHIGEGGRKAGY